MIIPVTIDKVASSDAREDEKKSTNEQVKTAGVCVPQWSMVELQGELISKDPLSGQPLGSMTSENVSQGWVCHSVLSRYFRFFIVFAGRDSEGKRGRERRAR